MNCHYSKSAKYMLASSKGDRSTHLNTNVPSQPLPSISCVLNVIFPTCTFPPPTSSASAVTAKLRPPKGDLLMDREPCESCWNSRTFKVLRHKQRNVQQYKDMGTRILAPSCSSKYITVIIRCNIPIVL